MINTKITKSSTQLNSEERLFKLLESIDWKLWEIYNMMKKELDVKSPKVEKPKKVSTKVEKIEEA